MYTIPNILCLGRIAASVPIFILVLNNQPQTFLIASVIFTLAATTDFLDGYLARRLNLVSSTGVFLDLMADKIIIASIMIALIQVGIIPAWIVAVIVAGEIWMTGLRSMALAKGRIIPAGKWGKRNTAITLIAISGLLLAKGLNAYQTSLFPPRLVFNSETLKISEILILFVEFLLLFIALFTVLLGIKYIVKTFRFLQSEGEREQENTEEFLR